MTDETATRIADHVTLSVYETPGGDWCISKIVQIGRHQQHTPVARFAFSDNAKTFAAETARMLADFYGTDDVQVME